MNYLHSQNKLKGDIKGDGRFSSPFTVSLPIKNTRGHADVHLLDAQRVSPVSRA